MLKSREGTRRRGAVERLQASETLMVADYRGLDVTQLNDVRTELLKHGARFSVVKNTLAKRAAEEAGGPSPRRVAGRPDRDRVRRRRRHGRGREGAERRRSRHEGPRGQGRDPGRRADHGRPGQGSREPAADRRPARPDAGGDRRPDDRRSWGSSRLRFATSSEWSTRASASSKSRARAPSRRPRSPQRRPRQRRKPRSSPRPRPRRKQKRRTKSLPPRPQPRRRQRQQQRQRKKSPLTRRNQRPRDRGGVTMAATGTAKLVEQLGKMSVLELVELKNSLEEEWGVSAAAPVAVCRSGRRAGSRWSRRSRGAVRVRRQSFRPRATRRSR